MKTITIEIQRGEGDRQHSVFETLYLDKRIYCPYCGTKGAMWIDEDCCKDNAGDLCLCVACGYTAFGLEWADKYVPLNDLYAARVHAIRRRLSYA